MNQLSTLLVEVTFSRLNLSVATKSHHHSNEVSARHPHRKPSNLSCRLKVIITLLACLPGILWADSTTVINEIHYHPADDSQTEWIELANTMAFDMDLGGWRLTGGVEYAFPQGTTIAAGRFLVVAADPSKVRLQSLFETPLGPFEGRLANQGERIELRNVSNRLMSWVDYHDREPWPVAADGSGASLAKRHPETDSASVESWVASREFGGTPGGENFQDATEAALRFTEVSPAAGPENFWCETSSSELKDHLIAIAGDPQREAVLPEGDFAFLIGSQLGFGATEGELLCLYSPDKTRVLDAVRVDRALRGRSADHPERWLFPTQATPGEANLFTFNEAIVINEIMYRAYPLAASAAIRPTFEQQALAGPDAIWRFWQGIPQQDALWQQIDYDDAAWTAGGPLFRSDNTILPEDTDNATSITIGKSVYYFRLTFQVDSLGEEQTLQVQHLVDDGAVLYLNGEEITRFNLPEGPVTSSTRALEPVENPAWSETLVIPAERVRLGANVIAAEVHQSSPFDRDVAFGARVSLGKLLDPGVPAQPFRESPEEWIELYNRSETVVDLSGWTLDEAVTFEFPQETILEPNGFLVVAKDSDGFQGSLNNGGETILLRDAQGNPADVVRYHDGGRWPAYADGGGSSLELRDPQADNGVAEAWAASDESAKVTWQEVRYRMVSGQSYGLDLWDELVLGMLSAGEVLLDDVKIVHDPEGAAQQLVRNSAFRGTLFDTDPLQRWRAIGNHRHTTAVPDPEDPSNTVLHLRASGTTDTKHNHVETTLTEPLIDGDEYDVSLRARWVAGSNQLNLRGHYARLARTVELAIPDQLGTPGQPNSRLVGNIGPTYREFQHAPLLPAVNEAVTVSVRADDNDGVDALTLFYAEDGDEGFVSVAMEEVEGVFTAEVPGMPAGQVVHFYVEGRDARGAVSHFPAAGPDARALYIVDDGRGTDLPVPELRLIMKEADFDFMFARLNLISNERLGCTVLVDNREIIYNTGVRLKGSPAGRARDGALYQGFNIAFPPEQLYRGIHSSVSVDRSGRSPAAGGQDEIYVKHLFNRAGIPAMLDDLGHIVSPTTAHTGTALFSMARYGRTFTDSQFENGSEGSVFNLEITYDPTTGSAGPESVKNPVPFSHGGMTDFADLGDDKEQYRWAFELRTGRRADEYEGLIRFCQTMDLPADQLARKINEVMDIDGWMRAAAMHNLCGIGDTWWNGGLQHNLRLYVPPGGQGVVGLPWDLDFVFSGAATGPIKTAAGNLRRVMDIPENTRLYYGHLLDIIDTVFNAEYMAPWLAHYGSKVGQNYTSQVNYIRARGNSVRSRVESEIPAIDFRLTTNGGASMTTEASSLTLQGEGWVNVRSIRLASEEAPLDVVWTSSKDWEIQVPLLTGPNEIALEAYDFRGALLGSQTMAITSTAAAPTPFQYLRITELHYHPAGDEDLEFIELQNLSDQPLDLTGVQFVDGIDFVFGQGTLMAPGSHAVLVRDRVAFVERYGTAIAILGEYGPATSLSNAGEFIELRHGPHRILAFDYRDDWAVETDGNGRTLVMKDPQADPAAWGRAESWGISTADGGSPGSAPEMATVATRWSAITLTDDLLIATYQRATNRQARVESSEDLVRWEPLILDDVLVAPINDDLELVTLRIPREPRMRYVRLVFSN